MLQFVGLVQSFALRYSGVAKERSSKLLRLQRIRSVTNLFKHKMFRFLFPMVGNQV